MIVESISNLFMKDAVYLVITAFIFYMIIYQLSQNIYGDNESNMFIFFISLLGFGIAKVTESKKQDDEKPKKNPISSGFYLGSIGLLITSFCGWSDMDNQYRILMLFILFFLLVWFYNKNKNKTKKKKKTKKAYIK